MNNDKLPEKPRGTESADVRRFGGRVKTDSPPEHTRDSRSLPTKPPASAHEAERMSSPHVPGRNTGEQIPRPESRPLPAEIQDGYVRMRLRVDDGGMTVVDSQYVAGPFRVPHAVVGETFYEVTDGSRLLQADSIPDLGVVRSFANPDGPIEQRRHHIYRPASYEFDIRVPANSLSGRTLPKISVVLYRTPQAISARALTDEPLGAQLSEQLEVLGRLDGLSADDLPVEVSSQGGRRKNPGGAPSGA
jgi:hypothetical protein